MTVTLITEVFSWRAKNGEKRKTSEEIVSKSCRVCATTRPGVWTCQTGQTGCVTGFSPSCHSRAWTVCISAGLITMAREEIGLQPRSKVKLRHAQQDFDTISSEAFFFFPFFACKEKLLLSGYMIVYISGEVSLRSCAQSRVQNSARSRGYMYLFLIGLFLRLFVIGPILT